MKSLRPLIDPGRRFLARHLSHLRQTLDDLRERLSNSLAHAIGQAVADAVREAVQVVLADSSFHTALPNYRAYQPTRSSPLWNDLEEGERERECTGLWPEQEDDLDGTALSSEPEHPKQARIGQAIVLGLQAAAWWLKRKKDRFPVLSALGLALVITWAVYAGGPMAGVGLMGSGLGLISLAKATETVAMFGRS